MVQGKGRGNRTKQDGSARDQNNQPTKHPFPWDLSYRFTEGHIFFFLFFLPFILHIKYNVALFRDTRTEGIRSLELQLQMVVSHYMGTGNQLLVIWKT